MLRQVGDDGAGADVRVAQPRLVGLQSLSLLVSFLLTQERQSLQRARIIHVQTVRSARNGGSVCSGMTLWNDKGMAPVRSLFT